MGDTSMPPAGRRKGPLDSFLDVVERIGNLLPDPVFLFAGAAAIVVILSGIGAAAGWSVQPLKPVPVVREVHDAAGNPVIDAATGERVTEPLLDGEGRPMLELRPEGEPIKPKSLLTAEGIYWALTSMVRNFINFPPLGIVLAGMLGIGLAEKVGMFGALMKWLASLTPSVLLTPTVVFLGVMSNVASDAGYVILPPLAAALYVVYGRPPLAGIAAAFAGVAGGFSANLLPAATDVLVAGLTTTGARVLEPGYEVNPVCNWYFMIVSTFLLTGVGWFVTARVVEPRLRVKPPEEGGPQTRSGTELAGQRLSAGETRGLWWAAVAAAAVLVLIGLAVLIPDAPLHGKVDPMNPKSAYKWTQAIVPMIFVGFLAPGVAYGMTVGEIKGQKDVARAFIHAIAGMAPIIVLAFFAAQFLEYMKYSNLDRMLAFIGGKALVDLGLPPRFIIIGVVILSLTINLLIASMSAKWAMLAPILVPMLMMVGISPELTQAAYRVGDSVTNVATPMNSYLLIILVAMQRWFKDAGIGTLIAMMVPYSVAFFAAWTLMLFAWVMLGLPLGPNGPLQYVPSH